MAAIATWIEEHGSARLKRLVTENLFDKSTDAKSIYENERLAIEMPNWTWANASQGRTKQSPSERSFALLDEARVLVPTAKLNMFYGTEIHLPTASFLGRDVVFCPPDKTTQNQ